MLFATVSLYYSDEYSVREDQHPLGIQDAYTKWDARLALTDTADTWEVALIGRNLTNEYVIQHAYEIAGANFASFSAGRTMTLQGTYRF
ncbi:MAG: TonB-dependent receptor [Gammaproteobacteria bacterium]|nr:TonB-dependent receptor [Gammaproteobacteria bacterium]